jgi:hypothetical protein
MLSVAYKPFMMSVVILNVIMLSVVEPTRALPTQLGLFISAVLSSMVAKPITTIFLVKRVLGQGPEQREPNKAVLRLLIIIILISYYYTLLLNY